MEKNGCIITRLIPGNSAYADENAVNACVKVINVPFNIVMVETGMTLNDE